MPEENVRARYERSGPLIRTAVLKAHFGYVFDNSTDGAPPRLLLQFVSGALAAAAADIAGWAAELYGPDLGPKRQ